MLNPETLVEPRSFAGLVTLYESNFIRLKLLVPTIESFDGTVVSRVANDCALHLRMIERAPYTATLGLTYRFEDNGQWFDEPDMTLRVYFDACLAEAQSINSKSIDRRWPEPIRARFRELDSRWARNCMLNKWLEYCYERGHLILA